MRLSCVVIDIRTLVRKPISWINAKEIIYPYLNSNCVNFCWDILLWHSLSSAILKTMMQRGCRRLGHLDLTRITWDYGAGKKSHPLFMWNIMTRPSSNFYGVSLIHLKFVPGWEITSHIFLWKLYKYDLCAFFVDWLYFCSILQEKLKV